MSTSPLARSLIFFASVLTVIVMSFGLAIYYHEEPENRVSFSLIDQDERVITARDLAGKHLIVFFGFTNCQGICPTQMSRLTAAMKILDETGHGQRVTPVFISVDPERDSPEKVTQYLANFDTRFVGLTGSRPALEIAASTFKTLLAKAPVLAATNYQISHSSIVYIVDEYSRVIDFISFEDGVDVMAARVREIL